jgi:hypothetical protein
MRIPPVSILSGTDAAIRTAVVVARCSCRYNVSRSWVGVLIFYVLSFEVAYLTWCDFWQLIRSSSMSVSARSFVRSNPTMQPSCPELRLWPWDKATNLPMENEGQSQEHRGWWWWTVGPKLDFDKMAAPIPEIMDACGNLVADILHLCLCATRHQVSHQ